MCFIPLLSRYFRLWNKRAARLALIRARVGTQSQRKKRGFIPAFLSFLTLCFWFRVWQNRQPQAPLPIRFKEPHIAELPQAMLGRPVDVITKVFAALTALKVGCQQHFVVRLTIQLVKGRSVASYI